MLSSATYPAERIEAMSEHTPGPWEAKAREALDIYDYNFGVFDLEREGVYIFFLQGHLSEQENGANARLIAESPTMYNLITRLVPVLESAIGLCSDSRNTYPGEWDDLQWEIKQLYKRLGVTIE